MGVGGLLSHGGPHLSSVGIGRGPQAQGAAGGARREAITLPPIHENHRLASISSQTLLALPTATYLPILWEGCKVIIMESLENLP